jgi:hypothetical protein
MGVTHQETTSMTTGPVSPAASPTASTARSALGTAALALTALSVVAMLVMITGSIADWKGFSQVESDESGFADAVWITFSLGGLLALVVGVTAWVRARRTHLLGDVRAGQITALWVVLAIAVSAIWSALD